MPGQPPRQRCPHAIKIELARKLGLVWAQGQAAGAIELWQQGEAATRQARQAHDRAVTDAHAQTQANAARGDPTVVQPPPFIDTGEPKRQAARDMLHPARQELADVGDMTAEILQAEAQLAPQDSRKQSDADFFGGIWSTIKGAGESLAGVITDPLGTVEAIAYNVAHPIETLKDAVAWDDWANGEGDRALGKIVGGLLLGGGIGKAAKSLVRRRDRGGGDGGDKKPEPPSSGGNKPQGVKDDWVSRSADHGKGTVYQRPGAQKNADMVRVMEPNTRYPNGYVRFYNEHGQPVGLNGKPGPNQETHIPRNSDGSYPVPQDW